MTLRGVSLSAARQGPAGPDQSASSDGVNSLPFTLSSSAVGRGRILSTVCDGYCSGGRCEREEGIGEHVSRATFALTCNSLLAVQCIQGPIHLSLSHSSFPSLQARRRRFCHRAYAPSPPPPPFLHCLRRVYLASRHDSSPSAAGSRMYININPPIHLTKPPLGSEPRRWGRLGRRVYLFPHLLDAT